jgi:hypothetical protein
VCSSGTGQRPDDVTVLVEKKCSMETGRNYGRHIGCMVRDRKFAEFVKLFDALTHVSKPSNAVKL